MFDKMRETGIYLGRREKDGKTTVWLVTEKMKSIKVKAPTSKTAVPVVFGDPCTIEATNAELKFQKFDDSFIEAEQIVVTSLRVKAAA